MTCHEIPVFGPRIQPVPETYTKMFLFTISVQNTCQKQKFLVVPTVLKTIPELYPISLNEVHKESTTITFSSFRVNCSVVSAYAVIGDSADFAYSQPSYLLAFPTDDMAAP